MTTRIADTVFAGLIEWSIFTAMGNTMPPRDPKDDDDDDDDDAEVEDGDAKPDDDVEPAVIREPDE
jgi:hypothetical protein